MQSAQIKSVSLLLHESRAISLRVLCWRRCLLTSTWSWAMSRASLFNRCLVFLLESQNANKLQFVITDPIWFNVAQSTMCDLEPFLMLKSSPPEHKMHFCVINIQVYSVPPTKPLMCIQVNRVLFRQTNTTQQLAQVDFRQPNLRIVKTNNNCGHVFTTTSLPKITAFDLTAIWLIANHPPREDTWLDKTNRPKLASRC